MDEMLMYNHEELLTEEEWHELDNTESVLKEHYLKYTECEE